MKKSNAPTMKDVAREAGVALGTVSRVFNGQSVGDDYRIRVEEAARRLGYHVNPLARGLKTNKSNIIAVLLPDTRHPYFGALANDLHIALFRKGCHMMLFLSGSDYKYEQECLRMVRQNKVDGIIGLTYSKVELGDDIPFISIDRHFTTDVPCVASDNYGGGRLAAELLMQKGCKKLLGVRVGSDLSSEADKRIDGFTTGCTLLNIPCDTINLNDSFDFISYLKQYFRDHITDGKLEYDGIFCTTDFMLMLVRNILHDLGITVPDDVQMIGFDGIKDFSKNGYYCSTIVQPTRAIADTCVDLLLREDRSTIPSLVCLPITFAEGGTTLKEGFTNGNTASD